MITWATAPCLRNGPSYTARPPSPVIYVTFTIFTQVRTLIAPQHE